MAYADVEKRRAAAREASRRYRARVKAAGSQYREKTPGELPDPPDHAELLRILGVQARNGNTAAIRLLIEEQRRDGENKRSEDPFTEFDELAAKRAA